MRDTRRDRFAALDRFMRGASRELGPGFVAALVVVVAAALVAFVWGSLFY